MSEVVGIAVAVIVWLVIVRLTWKPLNRLMDRLGLKEGEGDG